MNTIRFPFMWERIQPTLGKDLDSTELQRMSNLVNYVTNTRRAVIVLDLHNYARYEGKVLGAGVPVTSLADVWGRLAQQFKNNQKVLFGLMNEPNGMSTDVWIQAANLGIFL
jgi:endoglucanase